MAKNKKPKTKVQKFDAGGTPGVSSSFGMSLNPGGVSQGGYTPPPNPSGSQVYNAPPSDSITATAQGLPQGGDPYSFGNTAQSNQNAEWGNAAMSGGVQGNSTPQTAIPATGTYQQPGTAGNYGAYKVKTTAPGASSSPNTGPLAVGFSNNNYNGGVYYRAGGNVEHYDTGGSANSTNPLQNVKSALDYTRQKFGVQQAFMPTKPAGPGGDQPNSNPFPTKTPAIPFGKRSENNSDNTDHTGDDKISAKKGGAIPAPKEIPYREKWARHNGKAHYDDGGPAPVSSDNLNSASQPQLVGYISGSGAMDPGQWQALNASVDPQGQMPQGDRTVAAIAAAQDSSPDAGAAAIQAARRHYDVHRMSAAKALQEGNVPLAADQATKAHDYVPDGTTTQFAPADNGQGAVTVTSHAGGQPLVQQELSPEAFHNVLRGPDAHFDNVVDNGAPKLVQQAIQPPQSENQYGWQSNNTPGVQYGGGAQPTLPHTTAEEMSHVLNWQASPDRAASQYNKEIDAYNARQRGAPPPAIYPGDNSNTGYWKAKGPLVYTPPDQRQQNERVPITAQNLQGDADRAIAFAQAQRANRETRANVAQYVSQATGRPVARNFQDEEAQKGETEIAKEKVLANAWRQRGAEAAQTNAAGRVQASQNYAGARVDSARIKAATDQMAIQSRDPNIAGAWRVLSGMAAEGATPDKLLQMGNRLGLDPNNVMHIIGLPAQQRMQPPQGAPQEAPQSLPAPQQQLPAGNNGAPRVQAPAVQAPNAGTIVRQKSTGQLFQVGPNGQLTPYSASQ